MFFESDLFFSGIVIDHKIYKFKENLEIVNPITKEELFASGPSAV
jgi:hypothetical protein